MKYCNNIYNTLRERAKKRREEKKFYKKHALPDIEENIDYEKDDKEQDERQIRPFGLFKYIQDNEAHKFRSLDYYNHYKRTERNVEDALSGLLNGKKQGMPNTIYPGIFIKINEVRLNKACTVIHVWWSLSFAEFEKDLKGKVADIQRRLTKARGYIAGQLTHALGLRYAPDIRFYIDKTEEEHKKFMAHLMKKLSSKTPNEELLEEIKMLRTFTPTQIAQLKSMIKNEEGKKRLDKLLDRSALRKNQEEAEQESMAIKRMKEEMDKLPKLKKVKQARLDAIKKKEEDIYRSCGYDPQQIMNPTIDDLKDIGDEFLYGQRRQIPSSKKKKRFDSEGKRIRKHPKDENGKKIRTRRSSNKAEKFWSKLN